MDSDDSWEEEAQWILGNSAESDIQNEPADHKEEEEEAPVLELTGQDILRTTIGHTGSVSLPPVPPFTPYEHCQPPHTRRVSLPPEFIGEAISEGNITKLSPRRCY